MKWNRAALSEWGCIVSGIVAMGTALIWVFGIRPSQGWLFPAILIASAVTSGFLFYLGKRLEVRKTRSEPPTGSTSDLLNIQHREIAKTRLEQLADDAMWLARLAPTENANKETACSLWNMFVSKWRTDVIIVLQNQFGQDAVAYFAEADGFNKHEPVGAIADESANSYRELLYCQRNLKNLKRNLR